MKGVAGAGPLVADSMLLQALPLVVEDPHQEEEEEVGRR